MAMTLDDIVNKEFKVVKNGYDHQEVEAFLDEILLEMETRETQTEQLRQQVATLTAQLEEARANAQAAAPAPAPAAPVKSAADERYSAESFELVLTKAKGAYEEIVAAADTRAAEIVEKANQDAAAIRVGTQSQIAELTEKLGALRKQTGDFYASVKKLMDEQSASMEQIKKLI